MESHGYYHITSTEPGLNNSVICELERLIGTDELYRVTLSSATTQIPDPATYPIDIKQACHLFMEHGINLSIIVLSHFDSTEDTVQQGPMIYRPSARFAASLPRRSHPCRNGISIWRPVWNGIGPENGLFKVYAGSHQLQSLSELRQSGIRATGIRIRADQVLVTHGGLWIEEADGEGMLMWMGISADILGMHINQESLAFVAHAYGGGWFLSHSLPPERDGLIPNRNIQFAAQDRVMQVGLPGRRSESAVTLLAQAVAQFQRIDSFVSLIGDPTGLILQSDYSVPDKDPRTAFLSVGRDDNMKRWFMRALAIRYLTQQYHLQPGRSIAEFLRGEGLPSTPYIYNSIKHGHKAYLVELQLDNAGIWLLFMGLFARFTQLPFSEVYSIPQILVERYPSITSATLRRSRLVDRSGRLYRAWIAVLGAADAQPTLSHASSGDGR
ncbi:hypothetical protein BDW74DRAFT_163583 [Aspergillus multicolor]|uniref:uncharacterized protein n=1 Tax=Aspergillus multicolor TaxID=41759 RepID=UPI003CCCD39A